MPISIPTSIAGISVPGAINGPLSLLYGNKYLMSTHSFPRDLGSNPTRNHVIMFTVMVPAPSNKAAVDFTALGTAATNVINMSTEGVTAAAKSAASGIAGAVGTAITGSKEAINTFLQDPAQAANLALKGAEYSANALKNSKAGSAIIEGLNNLATEPLTRTPGATIALYIPDTVHVQYSASYDDFNMADALGTPYFLAQGATSLLDAFKNDPTNTASGKANAAANDPFVRAGIAKALGCKFGLGNADDLNALGQFKGGYASNPQTQVLFKKIDFRSFQFDFVLTPHTKEESEAIKKIIYAFKYASAPEFRKNGDQGFSQSLFMTVPDTFKIKFLYNGKENENVNKIGDCVLQSINVDYAPNGWSTFNDGAPVQTRLTLQFQETMLIDKNRIKEGY
jgi:hypothetical protein